MGRRRGKPTGGGDERTRKFEGMGIYIDFKGEAYEGQFEKGKKNGMLNKYKMQIDSTCVYEDDKLIESHEKEKNSEKLNLLTKKNLGKLKKNKQKYLLNKTKYISPIR